MIKDDNPEPKTGPITRGERPDDLAVTGATVFAMAVLGTLAIGVHGHPSDWGTLSMWALACLSTGAAAGFLFGIPKILQRETPSQDPKTAADSAVAYRQQVNTNLEQISDWLTKIIVGLGLVQLRSIPRYTYKLAALLASSMKPGLDHRAFSLALVIYFNLDGFLSGYLLTRLYLAQAFSRADQASATVQKMAADIQAQETIIQRMTPVETSPTPNAFVNEFNRKLIDDYEWDHLLKLASGEAFPYQKRASFEAELRRLRTLGFVANLPGTSIAGMPTQGDLRNYIAITDRGKQYVSLRRGP